MEPGEEQILITKSLVSWTLLRTKVAWADAETIRTAAEQSQARIHETRCRLARTDVLLRELERHLPGYSRQPRRAL
jgi:hypothetical protein